MQNYDEVEEKLEEMFSDMPEKDATPSTSHVKTTKPKAKKTTAAANKKKKNAPVAKHNGVSHNEKSNHNENKGYRGPCIQIKNNKTIILNFPNDDDDQEKNPNKSRVISKKLELNHVRGMHASTLSSKYDANNTDETWTCAFCHHGPHRYRMGDLLGPIIITEPSTVDSGIKSPRKKLEAAKGKKIEVWAHEDCVVSASGVYIIGTKIVGLEDAIIDSRAYMCTICQNTGATINCIQKNCNLKAHYICGRKQNWHITDDFRYFCDQHAPPPAETE